MNKKITKIFIPRETAAMSMGSDELAEKIALFSESKNISIEIVRNGSWGMSWLEPLIEVDTSDGRIAYGPVSIDDIESLFESNFLEGSDHALCQGKTQNIPYLKSQQRWTFRKCGLIDPTCIHSYIENDGYLGLKKSIANQKNIINQIDISGLRGRGGAGFPTGIKWKTVENAEADQKFIACNADEGDSGTFSDRILMESDPFALIEGMTIAGIAVGANRGYIYLRSEYPHAYNILLNAVETAKKHNWLGENIQDSEFDFNIDIHVLSLIHI